MAKKPTIATTKESKLKLENERLKKENEMLKKQTVSSSSTSHRLTASFWRKFSVFLLVSIAGALLVAGNILFWAGRTVVNTDSYVQTVGPLIEQPAVQKAVAQYTTDQIFNNVDVQAIAQDALPPKAEFLAPTLTTQLKTYTQTSLEKLVSSDQFQKLWTDTQRNAHERLITGIRNYNGDGTISIQDVYQRLTSDLGNTRLSFLSGKQLPPKVGSITVVNAERLPAAHNLVVNLPKYRLIAILALIASAAGAVWVSVKRRKTVIALSVLFSVLMFLTLVAVRIMRTMITNNVNPMYQEAASEASKVIFHPFVLQTATLFFASIVMGLIAWVSGTSRSARVVRGRVEVLFSGHVHQALFGKHENGLTRGVGRHKTVINWSLVGIFSVVLLMARITTANLIAYVISLIIAVIAVEILAEPQPPVKQRVK